MIAKLDKRARALLEAIKDDIENMLELGGVSTISISDEAASAEAFEDETLAARKKALALDKFKIEMQRAHDDLCDWIEDTEQEEEVW